MAITQTELFYTQLGNMDFYGAKLTGDGSTAGVSLPLGQVLGGWCVLEGSTAGTTTHLHWSAGTGSIKFMPVIASSQIIRVYVVGV